MRASVEANSHPAALVELVGVLMRAVLADRSELPAAEALGMARLSVEELYRQGDPVALVHLLDLGSELISEPRTQSSQRSGTVRDFFATAVGPREITRVLLALDPSQTQASSELGRLVGRLPDAVLQSVLEVAARDPDSERGRALQSTLGQVVGDRVNGWLQNAALQSPERVLPTLALARSLGSEVAERTRPSLLTHPARLVREEVLRWYRDSLPAEDLKLLLPLTVDPAPSVRREVCEVLKAHRPYEAVSWLRRLVSAESFGRRAPEIKRDVCVIFALLGGDGAVETLEKLLDREPGKGADRAGYLADLEAAATGIAAVGSVQARQTLKRRSGGFFGGARKKACAAALKHFDDMGNL